MKYFYVNLAVHVLIFSAFVVLMIIFLKRNNKRKTKHGVFYLAPVFFAALAILDMLFFTGPRILDIKNVANKTYQLATGKVEKIGYLNNTITIDGKKYYVNPLAEIPPEGTTLMVEYTEYGHYIIELSEASQIVEEDMELE